MWSLTPSSMPVMADEEQGFDPDDLHELNETFARVTRDADQGYTMEFSISRLQARELLGTWVRAQFGDPYALATCIQEYGKIMDELKNALDADDR